MAAENTRANRKRLATILANLAQTTSRDRKRHVRTLMAYYNVRDDAFQHDWELYLGEDEYGTSEEEET